MQESYYLGQRYSDEPGITFTGVSLTLLAASMFFLAVFITAVTRGWLNGEIPMPHQDSRNREDYQGAILVRYWYWFLPIFIFMAMAYYMA